MLEQLREDFKKGEVLCEVDLAMRVIGGKWKTNILWHLYEHEVLRYGELKRLLGKITPKMLTQQLRELEECDLVDRRLYHQVPPKVEYSLTKRGKTFSPVLVQICQWSMENLLKDPE